MKQNTVFPSAHSGVANCTGLIAFSYSIFPADNSHLIGFLHLFYAPARGLMKLVCIFISNITALCRIRYFGFSVRIAFSIFLRLRIIPVFCLVFKPHRLCLHNIIYNPSPGRVNKKSVRCFSANYQIAAVRKIIAFCDAVVISVYPVPSALIPCTVLFIGSVPPTLFRIALPTGSLTADRK